jgi:hypothetical protein
MKIASIDMFSFVNQFFDVVKYFFTVLGEIDRWLFNANQCSLKA